MTACRVRSAAAVAAAMVASMLVVSTAAAAERRMALLVAHPFGGSDLLPLRYTANDVDRVREVLQSLGGFAEDDVIVSFGEDADEVLSRFDQLRARVSKAQRAGDETLFVFYYSGHAKDGELRLGDSRLPLATVKSEVERSKADVRIALLDSCRSGSITRLKGATKGEPITMSIDDGGTQVGQVLITASSASEDAQESDNIQGSFFTHFLTSGLRGAADENDDRTVTLGEAYAFAYGHTVATTIGTRGGVQHPTYRYDLQGAGDIVVTRVGQPPSSFVFPEPLSGHFVVFDMKRRIVVAEFHKDVDRAARVGIIPGRYVIKKRETDHLRMRTHKVRAGDTIEVDPNGMEKVAFADDYAKGAIITLEEARYGKVGYRLSAWVGPQIFLAGSVRDQYVPVLGMVSMRFDMHNLFRNGLGLRLDAGFGGSGEQGVTVSDPFLGNATFDANVSEVTAGAALTAIWAPRDWLELGGNFRVGWIRLERSFADQTLASQTIGTLTPSVGLEMGFRLASWLRAGVSAQLHYMYFNGDSPQSLALLDGGLVLTAVFR